jgi:hypothetical protein
MVGANHCVLRNEARGGPRVRLQSVDPEGSHIFLQFCRRFQACPKGGRTAGCSSSSSVLPKKSPQYAARHVGRWPMGRLGPRGPLPLTENRLFQCICHGEGGLVDGMAIGKEECADQGCQTARMGNEINETPFQSRKFVRYSQWSRTRYRRRQSRGKNEWLYQVDIPPPRVAENGSLT